eukprot:maker-scaffold_3-augustus-gene-0.0-mRNA-1 protein AED:0.02 eAED:0.02 QI:0/0/0/1/0.5/0/3/0/4475
MGLGVCSVKRLLSTLHSIAQLLPPSQSSQIPGWSAFIEHEKTLYARLTSPKILKLDPRVHKFVMSKKFSNKAMAKLEDSLEVWDEIITQKIKEAANLTCSDFRPLSEVILWRDRQLLLSSLLEQVDEPLLRRFFELAETTNSEVLVNLCVHIEDLQRVTNEATDVTKFLVTLEQPLKRLQSTTTTLDECKHLIGRIFSTLKIIWAVSRHFNTDERMSLMLEKIAHELCGKVQKFLVLGSLFTSEESQVLGTIDSAKHLLLRWEENYLLIRQEIEESGKNQRWEFDRKLLFLESRYLCTICCDLTELFGTIFQFRRFFNVELSLICHSTTIKSLHLQLDNVAQTLQPYYAIVFCSREKEKWNNILVQFREEISILEENVVLVVDKSFQSLESSANAFNLLRNFKPLDGRHHLNQKVMEKFEQIIQQYLRELERLNDIFKNGKSSPPIESTGTPCYGAFIWARTLHETTKESILKIKTMERYFENLEVWKVASRKYIEFGKQIRQYLGLQKRRWQEKQQKVRCLLKRPVLSPIPISKADVVSYLVALDKYTCHDVSLAKFYGRATGKFESRISAENSHTGKKIRISNGFNSLAAHSVRSNNQARSHPAKVYFENYRATDRLSPLPFTVNYNVLVKEFIDESKRFSELGLKLPSYVRYLILKQPTLEKTCESLRGVIFRYEKCIESLKPVEKVLLKSHIDRVKQDLFPGFVSLNWNSLIIEAFSQRVAKSLSNLEDVLSRVKKTSGLIDDILLNTEQTSFFELDFFAITLSETSALDISILVNKIEDKIAVVIDALTKQHETISPLVKKIEEAVFSSNEGNCRRMQDYYSYYEEKIYNSLLTMVLRNILTLQALLGYGYNEQEGTLRLNKGPLIKVYGVPQGESVGLSPSLSDLYKFLNKLVNRVIETSKQFLRWERHSCIPYAPVYNEEGEEIKRYSYYSDITTNPVLIKISLSLNHSFRRSFKMVRRYLDTWKRFDLIDSAQILQEQASKTHSLRYFDDTMYRFQEVIALNESIEKVKRLEYLQIDCSAVSGKIVEVAKQNQIALGQVLYQKALCKLSPVQKFLSCSEVDLHEQTDDIKGLKKVLHLIALIGERNLEIELKIKWVSDHFWILKKFHLLKYQLHEYLSQEDLDILQLTTVDPMGVYEYVQDLESKWRQLYCDSKTRSMRLCDIISEFKITTTDSVKTFETTVKDFHSRFVNTGPKTKYKENDSLDDALQLLFSYATELAELKAKKEEFSNAEKLFGLERSSFPMLVLVEKEMEALEIIFGYYKKLKDFEESMASTLWTELEISVLRSGAEEVEKLMRKSSKEIKAFRIFHSVEEAILKFKESVPLLEKLKTDALKSRHWESLQRVTKVSFKFDKNFTLAKLFEMKLSRFEEEINEIVNEAVQEAKIEKQLSELAVFWEDKNFNLSVYKKDGIAKGYVIKSSEELRLEIEDNLLNLQTISGSRFISSFVEVVSEWEKKLNHVLETLDILLKVQSKWMYLESIFIGAEDIRMQLPEEARKFDATNLAITGLMEDLYKKSNVVNGCYYQNIGRVDFLTDMSEELDRCQKSLSDYLDTKRNSFPRFFFISDDELLSVLGSSDPAAIQVHMLKLFDNTKLLHFSKNMKQVVAISSSEGEEVFLSTKVQIDGPVEKWMLCVDQEMKNTVKNLSKRGIYDYVYMQRSEWIESVIGMVSVLGSQVWWTCEVEDVFYRIANENDKYALKIYAKNLSQQLERLVEIVRTDISSHMRKKVNTLLIIEVHARDIVDSFVRDSILDAREFAWESQLRFYWYSHRQDNAGNHIIDPDTPIDGVNIKQCTGLYNYGYEYMGLTGRLVITGLTDRCYMTITTGLTFFLGTAPSGPAGSIGYAGRTELPDNLKALFRPVTMIVPDLLQICEIMLFSEGFALAKTLAKKMTTLYKLAKGQLSKQFHYDFGLRALKSVLVMAGSLKREYKNLPEDIVLMRALRDSNMPKFVFEDVPLFKGLIADLFPGLECPRVTFEVLKTNIERYLDERFFHPRNPETFELQIDKIIQMYETLLTRHTCMIVGPTDGSKSVILDALRMAQGAAFNQVVKIFKLNPKAQPLHELYGDLDPITREWTDGVLSNLFRSMNEPLPVSSEFGSAREIRWLIFDGDVDALWVENMNSVMDDNRLLTLPNGERIRLQDYCKLLVETFDLQYASPATISRCGMVYVDPRNLGYVCYFERWLKLRTKGKTYMTSLYLEYEERRNKNCSEEEPSLESQYLHEQNEVLDKCFSEWAVPLLDYIEEGIVPATDEETESLLVKAPKKVVSMTAMSLVKQMCKILDVSLALAANFVEFEENDSTDETRVSLSKQSSSERFNRLYVFDIDETDLQGLFVFAIVWSIYIVFQAQERVQIEEYLSKLCPLSLPKNIVKYFYDPSLHKWIDWESKVSAYKEPKPFCFSKIFVPTTDNVMYTNLLQLMTLGSQPTLFVGEPGTAKTIIIQNFLKNLDEQKFRGLTLNFSSRTNSLQVQMNIENNVDKRTKNIYGPIGNRKLVVFIDDLNMPRVDTYGTQQPLALMLFLLDTGSLYGRGKNLELKEFRDLLFVSAMNMRSGNSTDPRYVSRFSVCNLEPPDDSVLVYIYEAIVCSHIGTKLGEESIPTSKKIIDMTLQFYQYLLVTFPATPNKFFYVFNLRDLSRVFEGFCQLTSDNFATGNEAKLLRLWRNESERIFCDRLNNESDIAVADSKLRDLVKTEFSAHCENTFRNPLIYGSFKDTVNKVTGSGDAAMLYDEFESYMDPRKIFDEVLELHNCDNKPMNLVLFDNCLENLIRIYRVLHIEKGHCLLIGVGGSGKQSLTKLASFALCYEVFELTLCRNYSSIEFFADLKDLFRKAYNTKISFLFTDAHVLEEAFLESVNNILATGTVPSLFESDEKDGIINMVRVDVKKKGLKILDTKEGLWAFFLDCCGKNLHLVLAMSPSGETLRIRCRSFPGLISGSVINFFFPWPKEALKSVASFFLQEEKLPKEHNASILEQILTIHLDVISYSEEFYAKLRRHNYVTPKNYLDFISSYRLLLKEKTIKNTKGKERLINGLQKLEEAEISVDILQKELEVKKVVVDKKTLDCTALIEDINTKQKIAEVNNEHAKEKKDSLMANNEIIVVEKAKADNRLEEALPLLDAAAEALNNLNKNDITEIKGFANPPTLVMQVCTCTLILKPLPTENDELSWKNCKTMLANNNFLNSLKTYNKDKITEKQIKKVKGYFKDPDFTLENMEKVSTAGSGLFTWVNALVKYYDVAKNVLPLKQKVERLEKEKDQGEKELAGILKTLECIETELDELNSKFTVANADLTELKVEAQLMEKRLIAASKLIKGLSSEKIRWKGDIQRFEGAQTKVIGDCLLGGAFLSYLGVFTADFRKALLEDSWQKAVMDKEIPLEAEFDILQLLTADVEIQRLSFEGLPVDKLSVENAVLTLNSSRFPLCIDPQEQAVKWIKNKEKENKLNVKTFADSDFMKFLELSLQFGSPFLFENVDEEIDPMINPVLEKNYYVENGNLLINLGDKTIDWDRNFRLFLTTKLANPHYSPEVMSKLMIINYSVTIPGLQDQLLNEVVAHERQDIEEKFAEVVKQMSQNAQELADLESLLLKSLAESTGNILDNVELIETLESAKSKSVAIVAQNEIALKSKEEIQVARKSYTEVAKRGSILFFAMSGLSQINKMYETSLELFLSVFHKALDSAKEDEDLSGRLVNLVVEISEQVYNYTCFGIFERHKLLFSMQMAIMISEGEGVLRRQELNFILKGRVLIGDDEEEDCVPDMVNSWLSMDAWSDLLYIESLSDNFNAISTELEKNSQEWKSWYDSETPEHCELPSGLENKLTGYQKLVLYRCFRPDRGYNAARLFIIGDKYMGEKFVQPPILNYGQLFKQSTCYVPMIFINSPGADPAGDIRKLFLDLDLPPNNFKTVSLGQGQNKIAMNLYENGMVRGHWVLLQNCHLLINWLKELEGKMETVDKTRIHENFRLWMTTDVNDKFPLGILQKAVKVVIEPPDGLKLNLRNTFNKVSEDQFEGCEHKVYKRLVYVLCFLHGVLQERRKYGKIGYNVAYDFNFSDFQISLNLLGLYLAKSFQNNDDVLPWKSLKYLIGDAMYGGRVSDDFDRRVLQTYVDEYFGDFLLDENNKFYFSKSGFDYMLPANDKYEIHKKHIEGLPLTCGPAVFGLHSNAEITYLTNATRSLYSSLVNLQPRTSGSSGGVSREDTIAQTAISVRKSLVSPYEIGIIKKKFGQVPTPTEVVLLQELERFNFLISKMDTTLADLLRALKGEVGMTDELEDLSNSLFNNYLPPSWSKLAPETQKSLSSWMAMFKKRVSQYQKWIEERNMRVIWLSGLHIPESYLTALVQTACRKQNWSLDKSTLYTQVTKFRHDSELTVDAGCSLSCFISGLYLEGAGWDIEHGVLKPQIWKQLVEEMPLVEVIPIEQRRLKVRGTFKVPVYVTQNRRNAMGVGLVFEASVGSDVHQSFWILQGVALCLNTDT